MTLTIDDPEARRLADAIARATGETVARVVTEALRQRHARIHGVDVHADKAGPDELRAIAAAVARRNRGGHADHGNVLYGEDGLPE